MLVCVCVRAFERENVCERERERERFIDILSPLSCVCRWIYLPLRVSFNSQKLAFTFTFFYLLSLSTPVYVAFLPFQMFVHAFEHYLAFSFCLLFFNFHFDITFVASMAWKLNFSFSLPPSFCRTQFFPYSHFLLSLSLLLSLHVLEHARTAL